MNVRVEPARRDDQAFARDDFSGDANDHSFGHAGHHIGIARLADAGDQTVLDTDVGFVDASVIQDERVGDDAIERVLRADASGLAHAFADDFAAAEFAFVAINGEILFDFEDE